MTQWIRYTVNNDEKQQGEQRISADFVEDVLFRYTISSK